MRMFRVLPYLLLCFGIAGASARKSIVPPFESIKTGNGVEILYFKNANLPLFQVEFEFSGGSDLDPDKRSGISMIAAAMFKRGLPGLDEDAISKKIDDLAAGIDISVSEEHASLAAYGLNEHAVRIIDLMFAELTQATFPERPFERLKANHLDAIDQLSDSPSQLAAHVSELVLFNGTSKARPGGGLRSDILRISLSDVRAYSSNLIRTDRLKVLVVGGEDRSFIVDKIKAGIERMPCLKCGQESRKARAYEFARWRVPGDGVLLVERPGITEAHVRMAMLGPPRRNPEFYDLRVAETVLSGYFASRMNMIIREKLNLTYNISAGFNFGDELGSFSVSTSTRNEKVGELVSQINKLLGEFVKEGITEQELEMAKNYITGSFPLGLQNLYVVSSAFFHGLNSGLEPDFLDTFQERINGATVASVNAAIRKHFKLGTLRTVVVGDSKALAPRLKQAKFKVITRDPKVFL